MSADDASTVRAIAARTLEFSDAKMRSELDRTAASA